MIENVKIRPLDLDRDFDQVLDCFNQGFEHTLWPTLRHASSAAHRDIVRLLAMLSTDLYAAEVEGEVHAVLFGATPLRLRNMARFALFFAVCLLPRGVLNRYRMNRLAYRHFFQVLYGFSFFLFYHSALSSTCEVMLFTSTRKYRSRGLGRKLMDAFVQDVHARGFSRAFVCTDTALSYRFYENYGFQLRQRFEQRAYRYSIPGRSFEARVYRLDLRDEVY